MGKAVKVRFDANAGDYELNIYRDLTVGSTYSAYLPEKGERDKHGLPVMLKDELWIDSDDIGDVVVGVLSDGFVIVA